MPRTEPDAYGRLLKEARAIFDLAQAAALLVWDQQTKMPPGGGELRGQQLATLSSVIHGRLTSEAMGSALDELAGRAGLDDEQSAQVRQARREYDLAVKVPADLVEALSEQTSRAQGVWAEARENDDFGRFAPELEKVLDLRRRQADHLGWDAHPYDALHDQYEPGSTRAKVQAVFEPLKTAVERLLAAIGERGRDVDDGVLRRTYDEALQEQFGREVVADFGYDFRRGRLDRAVHPFAQGMGRDDVRITTRYRKDYLSTALFGTMHEAGHAMYEQGIAERYHRTPLGSSISLGVHESQSRLWENLVGRSHAFWEGRFPRLVELFPEQLEDVSLDSFVRAVNRVAPSLIRVEADEVTYNLHVMIRFELEVALLEGSLPVAELPDAWNAKYAESLGITPPDDARGCLQDVHWSIGLIGYFPTYTLGNLMSVQLFEAADAAIGGLEDKVRNGEFAPLLAWLRENVHEPGSRWLPGELLERATGQRLDAGPYLRYLERKYGRLYELGALELSPVSAQR